PQQVRGEQHRCLPAPFAAGKAEMEIEEMKALPAGKREVRPQAPARLAARDRQVVVVRVHDGKAGEDGVSIRLPAQDQVRAIGDEPTEPAAQPRRLIGQLGLDAAAVRVADLLERGHLALHVLEERRDAAQIAPSIAPEPAVDVPGHEAHVASSLAPSGSSRGSRPLRSRKKRCRSCGRTSDANAPSPSSCGWIMKVSSWSGARPPCEPNSKG